MKETAVIGDATKSTWPAAPSCAGTAEPARKMPHFVFAP